MRFDVLADDCPHVGDTARLVTGRDGASLGYLHTEKRRTASRYLRTLSCRENICRRLGESGHAWEISQTTCQWVEAVRRKSRPRVGRAASSGRAVALFLGTCETRRAGRCSPLTLLRLQGVLVCHVEVRYSYQSVA